MDIDNGRHRAILRQVARRAMSARGLLTDFSADVREEVAALGRRRVEAVEARDLRDLPWCSIDNDDSRDLDQLTVAEALPGDRTRVLVAVADVTALVDRDGPVDAHAGHNTTSVYTAAQVFPMLPDELSTGLTSLNPDEPRLAMVVEMEVSAEGEVGSGEVYRAWVRNRAKLAYNAWRRGSTGTVPRLRVWPRCPVCGRPSACRTASPPRCTSAPTLAARSGCAPWRPGRCSTATSSTTSSSTQENRAKQLIESFMMAANQAVTRFLEGRGLPSLRRVVREPRRWDRIVALAAQHGTRLPATPDGRALEAFLHERRAADPLRFPDLSLAVVKLLGSRRVRGRAAGPRGAGPLRPGGARLRARDRAQPALPRPDHPAAAQSRARRRRALTAARSSPPWPRAAPAAGRRRQGRAAGAQVGRGSPPRGPHGQLFDGLVTGASAKGTWVRIFKPPVEGRVVRGEAGLDVGDRVRVRLLGTDVQARLHRLRACLRRRGLGRPGSVLPPHPAQLGHHLRRQHPDAVGHEHRGLDHACAAVRPRRRAAVGVPGHRARRRVRDRLGPGG